MAGGIYLRRHFSNAVAPLSRLQSRSVWELVIFVLNAAIFMIPLVGAVYWLVSRQAGEDESRQAEAIVVFGAAEYSGHPSPIYRARLDHAYTLFKQGMAPLIITTGGAAEDP